MLIITFSKPNIYGVFKKLPTVALFTLLIFTLPLMALFSLPPQKVLHPDDWAYDALAILSREQGRVFFADSRITVVQMENFLAEINPDSLSESGLAIYDRLTAYLKSDYWLGFRSDAISGGFDLILQPEFYYKTNEHNPWVFNDYSRSHLFQLPWGFSLGRWVAAEMDFFFGENEYASSLHDNYSNVPIDVASHGDIHTPKRAYVSAGLPIGKASGVNMAIGLGNNFFGDTRTGSIIVSEYLERTVYAQASMYSPAFKYTAEVVQYEVNKYQYMHYIQARLHRTISVSLGEGVIVNAPLELRFLNPFTIFHSYESYKTYTNYNEDQGHETNDGNDPWGKNSDGSYYDRTYDPSDASRIASYLGVKIEWQPVRLLRLYGLFAMNQYQLPVEKSKWEDSLTPNALAFQAGFDLSLPGKGGYWEFGLEGVYTYPFMYVLWDKNWSLYKEVPELDKGDFHLRYWTGSPFGPDTIAGVLWAGFRASALWYAGFSFTFSAQGERSDFGIFDIDNSIDDTYRPTHKVYDETVPPTGIPVYTYTTSISGEYSPRKWLTFILQPSYRVTVNAGDGPGEVFVSNTHSREEGRVEHGFEIAFSMRFRPPVKQKKPLSP